MSDKLDRIIKTAEDKGGLIKSSEIEKLGNSRVYISELVDSGLLIREARGIYSVRGEEPDEFAVIQKRSAKLIYSYGTALFFHDLTDRVPGIIDITVPQGYNVSRIADSNERLRFHYVKGDIFLAGVETVLTPQGYEVAAYSKERCICDLIKGKRNVDKQLYTQALQRYFDGHFKQRELISMARIIGVEQSVRDYMEVLQKQ
ncbi:MAG: type IV toxin-antitoxin system AbiEi family antitoxin domain-containing protein [Erysipelotrichaceae bacterium]|nr:type IV toxin-antitoxin system AbiEi family antitoxin domain-containing protein [Erysipelotrichaceae bacterium]MBR5048837.1 type IV toxin-antitoxin system AbiEi family antitoxin domain-containing protein [Erysipelotrichaceae bacterium]